MEGKQPSPSISLLFYLTGRFTKFTKQLHELKNIKKKSTLFTLQDA